MDWLIGLFVSVAVDVVELIAHAPKPSAAVTQPYMPEPAPAPLTVAQAEILEP